MKPKEKVNDLSELFNRNNGCYHANIVRNDILSLFYIHHLLSFFTIENIIPKISTSVSDSASAHLGEKSFMLYSWS
jgi:hypothetical protein